MGLFGALLKCCVSFILIAGINADCEFPGIPNGIDVANFKFLKYTENATAFYRCKDPNDIIILAESNGNFGLKSYSTRYCANGKWFGHLPQCGRKGDRQLPLKRLTSFTKNKVSSEIVLASDDVDPKTAQEFFDDDNCIEIVNNDVRHWIVDIDAYTLSTYIEIEIKLEDDNIEDESLTSLPLEMNTGPHQRCELVSIKSVPRYAYSGNQGVIRSFITKNFNVTQPRAYFVHLVGFLCTTLLAQPKNDSSAKSFNETISAYFTNTFEITVDNSQIGMTAFCDIKVLHPEPFKCGRPEVPLNGKHEVHSLVADIPATYGDFSGILQAKVKYRCNDHFELHYTDGEYVKNGGLLCGPDGRWIGQAPTCKPIASCPMTGVTASDTLSVEYEKYTFWNASRTAYKGTTATYTCRNNGSSSERLTLSGIQIVTCESNGQWSYDEPKCLPPVKMNGDASGQGSHIPLFTLVIYTLVAALLGLAIIAGIASCIYVKKVRARKEKERNRRRTGLPRHDLNKKEEDNYYTIYYDDMRKSGYDRENYIIPTERIDYSGFPQESDYMDMTARGDGIYDDIAPTETEHNYMDLIVGYANEFIRRDSDDMPPRQPPVIKHAKRPRLPLPFSKQVSDDTYDDVGKY